jgi:excisionase family DNA binding protein
MSTALKHAEPTPQTDPWMSVPAAARALGVTPPTVIAWAFKGRLVHTRVAGRTVVSRESVEKLIAERVS